MYLPDDIQDIIYGYIHQLKLKRVMDELKISIRYNYISPYFSEIMYMDEFRIITYYHNNDNLLLMYKNSIFDYSKINKNTNITIIKYL